MDVIKSRIQARAGTENAYKGIADATRQMLAKAFNLFTFALNSSFFCFKNKNEIIPITLSQEGIFVFYKGFTPTLIQAFPLHGSVFMVYELWCRYTGLKH